MFGFDAGPEGAQLAIDPAALDHVLDAQVGFLVEGHVADPTSLGLVEIMAVGEAAIGGGLTRCLAIEGDVALQHGQKPGAVRRVAGFDNEVEDQAAPAGCQVELVTVFDVAATFDDDVGMRLEQADDLVAGADLLTPENPTLGLPDDPRGQRAIMAQLGLPE